MLGLMAWISASGQEGLRDTAQVNQLIVLSKKDQWIDSYRSLNYADEALKLAQDLGYGKGIAQAHNLKGFCFWTFGDNELAIQSALQALTIAQNEKYPLIQAESRYILARGYMDLNENRKALASIAQAEALATAGNDWTQLCSIYNLRGVILFVEHHEDSALHFYNKAYETGKRHGVDPINFPRIISNIGECYLNENPALAFRNFNQALALAKETHNKIAEASITAILGHAYLRGRDIKNAEAHLQAALQLARELGLRRVIRHAYGGLVDIKLLQGKGEEAVVYLRRYYAVRDSLLNTSKVRQIVELEAGHELQMKEQKLRLLESEKRAQVLLNELLIAVLLILMVLSAGIILHQRYRHRKNREVLNLEIDYLTQQHKAAVDKYKTLNPEAGDSGIESYEQKLLKKAIAIVEANIGDPGLGVEKMAEEMNMSRTSLHRKIKSITGFPPSELIRSIRLRKAARLIAHRADSATQIALRVGFDDYSHFSKAFKKHFGVSPSGYEERARSQQQAETAEPVSA